MIQQDGKMMPVQESENSRKPKGSQYKPQQPAHGSHNTPFSAVVIGTEKKLFVPNSAARRRMAALGARIGRLSIICFTLKKEGFTSTDISPTTRVYATNSRSRLWYVVDAMRLAKEVGHASVVSAQDPFESGLAGFLVARKIRAPLQIQVHTDLMSPHFKKFFLNRIRLVLAHFLLPRASSLRVVSERIKRSLAPLRLKVPVAVFPIYADVSQSNQRPSGMLQARFAQFSPLILVVSRLELEKNVAGAVQAFAHILPQFPRALLLIVGTGSQKASLQSLVHALGIEKSVVFEGFQDPAHYYKDADALLNASWYEGYGLAIVEAMAAGCPVVSSDVGVAKEAGAVVASDNKLGEALIQVLRAPRQVHLQISMPTEEEYLTAYQESLRTCASAL